MWVLDEAPAEQVWDHYCEADIFTLPSYTEGFPNVLLEAMMAGLPSVVTPVGAVPEVAAAEQTALFVPVGEAAPLRKALARLVQDRDLRLAMGRAAHARAAAEYELEVVVEQLCREYDSLLGVSTR